MDGVMRAACVTVQWSQMDVAIGATRQRDGQSWQNCITSWNFPPRGTKETAPPLYLFPSTFQVSAYY